MEGGIEFHDVKHALLEFSRTVRTRAGDVVKAGTQVLDRQWRSLKDYLPKSLATKSKAGHVNQSLWQWTYSWQYRYNNGKDLWTAVPTCPEAHSEMPECKTARVFTGGAT